MSKNISDQLVETLVDAGIQNIYLCGPPPVMHAIEKQLANLKIDEKQIIKEVF
jgi:ferredoxin-NADP reductase